MGATRKVEPKLGNLLATRSIINSKPQIGNIQGKSFENLSEHSQTFGGNSQRVASLSTSKKQTKVMTITPPTHAV